MCDKKERNTEVREVTQRRTAEVRSEEKEKERRMEGGKDRIEE